MSDRWRYWDWAMFCLAASLMLSPDLSMLEITALLVIVASALLGGAE